MCTDVWGDVQMYRGHKNVWETYRCMGDVQMYGHVQMYGGVYRCMGIDIWGMYCVCTDVWGCTGVQEA